MELTLELLQQRAAQLGQRGEELAAELQQITGALAEVNSMIAFMGQSVPEPPEENVPQIRLENTTSEVE